MRRDGPQIAMHQWGWRMGYSEVIGLLGLLGPERWNLRNGSITSCGIINTGFTYKNPPPVMDFKNEKLP